MKQTKWVLWQRVKGSNCKYELRQGRYRSKESAEDAIRNLKLPDLDLLALPEGKEPQANRAVGP